MVRQISALATFSSLALISVAASAQQVQVQVQGQYQPQQPVYVQQAPPPPPNTVTADGQYVAPMQQTTQQTYVPQSVAMSGPRVIRDWHEGDPIPPGYHPATRLRTGMVVGGATMFGVPYLISVLIAAAGSDIAAAGCTISNGNSCTNGAAPLYIPVVGPFVEMGMTDSALADVFLVIDGLLQATGVAMFIYGLAVPKTVLVRNDLGALKNVHIAPIAGRNMGGIGIRANF